MKLSICIPTYNFGRYIGETLDSIIAQADHNVEICVLDGGSTDNTEDVVISRSKTFSRLRYVKKDKRGGIDRDLAEAVSLGEGDYCWILSSDDILRPGGIKRITGYLEQESCDVYLCGLVSCDISMRPRFVEPILPETFDRVINLSDSQDRLGYFSNAKSLAAFFSFCSSLIVSRERWCRINFDPTFDGSCYAHVARIFEMIRGGLKLRYIAEPILDKRGENDSFLANGALNRVRIDVDGYNALAGRFFGAASQEAFHIRRVLRKNTGINHLFSLKINATKSSEMAQLELLDRLVSKLWCDPLPVNIIKLAAFRHTPFGFYRLVNAAYRPIKAILRVR
jgi:abequosyltransferase